MVAATINNATDGEPNKGGEIHAHPVRGFGNSFLFVVACSEFEATHGTLLRSGHLDWRPTPSASALGEDRTQEL